MPKRRTSRIRVGGPGAWAGVAAALSAVAAAPFAVLAASSAAVAAPLSVTTPPVQAAPPPATRPHPDPPPAVVDVQVRIEGVDGDVEENVRRFLTILQAAEAEELRPARVERLHRQAEQEIREAVQPFGYYRPRVESALDRASEGWTARYAIDLGPPVRVERTDLRLEGPGRENEILREQVAAFPLRSGDRLDHRSYEDAKDLIHTVALEQGYLDAEWREARVEVDTVAGSAWIRLELASGPRFRFGEVGFEHVDNDEPPFAEEFLRRFVPFREGDTYRSQDLLALQEHLAGSAYFEGVEISARPEDARELHVPIEVRVAPASSVRYGVGGGYGTDTGPRATATLTWNRVNRRGHRLISEGHASFISRRVGARYMIPVGPSFGARLSVGGTYEAEFFDDNRSRRLRGTVSYDRDWRGLRQRFSVDVRQEWFRIGRFEGERTVVLPGVSVSRTRADDPVFVQQGHRILAEVNGSHQAIGSDVDLLQGRVEGRLVRSPWDRGRLIGRLELGATRTDRFGDLPLSLRYFAGGERSVRGYGLRQLGPRGPNGEPTGGRYLLTGTLELEHRFLESWGAAVFLDVGNVWQELGEVSLEEGAGVGARWISPVGVVRVDLATQLGNAGLPLRLHVILGPDL